MSGLTKVHERRRHPRTQLQMTLRGLRLEPEGGDVLDTLYMLDISKSGMGVVSDRLYYPGQRVILRMPVSPDNGRRNIYATVVRCRPEHEGYHLGLQFDSASVATWCGVSTAALAA